MQSCGLEIECFLFCVLVIAVFVNDADAAAFTIKTIDDPRTLNKTLYLRPPGNICSMNDLVELWEGKIKKKLEKIFVTENQLLEKIKGPSQHPSPHLYLPSISLKT